MAFFASLAYAFHSLIKLLKKNFSDIERAWQFQLSVKFEADIQKSFEKLSLKRLKLYKECMGSLMFLSPGNFQFSVAAVSFAIACKKLKSAQITQIKQLFQLFNLICAYGYTFYGVTLMLNYEQKCKQWCQQRFAYYIKTCTYHMYLYCTSLLFSFFQWCLPLHFYFNCCSTFSLNNTCLHLPFLRNNHRRWSDCQRGWRQEDRW